MLSSALCISRSLVLLVTLYQTSLWEQEPLPDLPCGNGHKLYPANVAFVEILYDM